ncbi:LysM domain/BON superfamily protein [Pirellulimonas nuda]|uniref:LysM domain/BON superfamily protein n=1 Tax=Pirellulimonas nuda TaxID=2528009 RepID=A0A518D9G6_9BACT|nr:hypothetical protein [Pirellulimonas nuda]QDU88121.1 LysM domain/BON superfamily protein [Pirellulimonas nuda]
MTLAAKSLFALVLVVAGFVGAKAFGPPSPGPEFWDRFALPAAPPAATELSAPSADWAANALEQLAGLEGLREARPGGLELAEAPAPLDPWQLSSSKFSDNFVTPAVATLDRSHLEPVSPNPAPDRQAPQAAPTAEAWYAAAPLPYMPDLPAAAPENAWGGGSGAVASPWDRQPPQLLNESTAPLALKQHEPAPNRPPAPGPEHRVASRQPWNQPPGASGDEQGSRTHVLTDGDTLPKLAERYLGSAELWPALYEANRSVLSHPELLPIGVEIIAPSSARVVQGSVVGDSLEPVRQWRGGDEAEPPRARLLAPTSADTAW